MGRRKGTPSSALRLIGRTLAIALLLVVSLVRFIIGWLALYLAPRRRELQPEWFARCLVDLLRRLGATFIKVGQIMSTRPDLFSPHLIRALEMLQDDVGPFAFSDVRQIFRDELGRSLDEVFVDFAPTPLASASVAQVHKARLKDGRVVAVKVRRPQLDELVTFDLAVMHLVARLLSAIPSLGLLAPVESVEEFGRGIRMQLDFTIEAENNRRFQRNFADDPDVLFPGLIEELCTRRILVMDFIDGTKILHVRETADPKRLAQIGFRVLLKMVFVDGFVHADLHPGNIFITRDHRLAILDLGLVGELDTRHRQGFARYFAAFASGDGATMARLMLEISPSRRVVDYPGFEQAVVEFVQRYHGRRLGEVEVSVVFLDMMNILRRFRVRVNPNFTLVNIAIAVTEGIGKQLDPEVDLMAAALPFFAHIQGTEAAGSG